MLIYTIVLLSLAQLPLPPLPPPVEFVRIIPAPPVPKIDLVNPPTPEPRRQTPTERSVAQLVDQLPRDKLYELHALISDPDANAAEIDLFVQRNLPQLNRTPVNSYGEAIDPGIPRPAVRRQTTYTYRTYTQPKQTKPVRRIWRQR